MARALESPAFAARVEERLLEERLALEARVRHGVDGMGDDCAWVCGGSRHGARARRGMRRMACTAAGVRRGCPGREGPGCGSASGARCPRRMPSPTPQTPLAHLPVSQMSKQLLMERTLLAERERRDLEVQRRQRADLVRILSENARRVSAAGRA